MLEDLFNNLLVLYESDDAHLALTFGASKRIYLPGSSPGQAPIFCIRRAQFFLCSLDDASGSRMGGIIPSSFCFFRFPRDTLL